MSRRRNAQDMQHVSPGGSSISSTRSDNRDGHNPRSDTDAETADALRPPAVGYRVPLYSQLVDAFGPKPVLAVGLTFFAVRGFGANGAASIQLPFYRDVLGIVDSSEYQRLAAIPLLGWALKPGAGLIADTFTLCGYRKRTYLILAILSAIAAYTFCGLISATQGGRSGASSTPSFPPSQESLGPVPLPSASSLAVVGAVALFVANIGLATTDLLTESVYAALMRRKRETGSTIVTWCWMCSTTGSVVALAAVGPLADAGQVTLLYLGTAAILCLALAPPVLNWYSEQRHPVADCGEHDRGEHDRIETPQWQAYAEPGHTAEPASGTSGDPERHPLSQIRRWWHGLLRQVSARLSGRHTSIAAHPQIAVFALAMSVATLAVAVTATLCGPGVRAGVLIVSVVCLSALSFECLPIWAARGNLFMFLKEAVYVQVPGALDYFYTADDQCVHGGPNFDYWYYQTVAGIVGCFASAAGTLLFEHSLSRRRYVWVFVVTTVAKIVASLFDIIIVTRYNVTHLGVSDKAMYLWGDTVVYNAVMMIDFMPMVVLMSRLCPPGIEAVMYALLAGYSNFGQNVARTLGEVLINAFGIRSELPCDFSRLPDLLLVAHFALPMLTFPLAFYLLPPRGLDEAIVSDESDEAELVEVHAVNRPGEPQ
jgi:folate/biopterin transporter